MLNFENVFNNLESEITDLYDKYTKIGIRVQDVPFELGECTHFSHVWIDGVDTGEELDGVCCVDLSTLNDDYSNIYFGDHAAIICGNEYTYGEDSGEIIIEDPVVEIILA